MHRTGCRYLLAGRRDRMRMSRRAQTTFDAAAPLDCDLPSGAFDWERLDSRRKRGRQAMKMPVEIDQAITSVLNADSGGLDKHDRVRAYILEVDDRSFQTGERVLQNRDTVLAIVPCV